MRKVHPPLHTSKSSLTPERYVHHCALPRHHSPPNGTSTTAHFHVISDASAMVSLMSTCGDRRTPPLVGVRCDVWCARYATIEWILPLASWGRAGNGKTVRYCTKRSLYNNWSVAKSVKYTFSLLTLSLNTHRLPQSC